MESAWTRAVGRLPWLWQNLQLQALLRHNFISANHVTRVRQAHQSTTASLHILQHQVYNNYLQEDHSENQEPTTFQQWQESISETSSVPVLVAGVGT